MASARPFLRILEPPSPVSGELPRMDVAAFAGFAEAGPFGVPVCVESPGAFRAVFGEELPLPGAPGRLAAAVAAFFAQDGRRAWVVRCGDAETAATAFPLPGVLAMDPEACAPALLGARSAGTFADDQRVGVTVRRERIIVAPAAAAAGPGVLELVAADRQPAQPALVELNVRRGTRRLTRYGVLHPARPDGLHELASPLTVGVPDPGDREGTVDGRTARLTRDAAGALLLINLPVGAAARYAPGQLAGFVADPAAPEPDTWMLVRTIGSPPPGQPPGVVLGGEILHVDHAPDGDIVAGIASLVTLDLAGRDLTGGETWRLDDAGCVPQAPGWPGDLVDDAARHAEAAGPVAAATLPVCGTTLRGVTALVPLFDAATVAEAVGGLPEVPPLLPPGDIAARNGLPDGPAAALLPAGAAATATGYALAALLDAHAADPDGPTPLPGLLALADAPEATLYAVPDAVVGPARQGTVSQDGPLRLPPLPVPPATGPGFGPCGPLPPEPALADPVLRPGGGVAVSWTVPEPLARLAQEVWRFAEPESAEPAERLYCGIPEILTLDTAGGTATLGITTAPRLRGWVRVRILGADGRVGPWSAGVRLPLAPVPGPVPSGDPDPDAVRRIHRLLLRLAATRGDVLAVLTAPPSWPAADVLAHRTWLQDELEHGEPLALAHGTLVHLWPLVPAPAPALVRAVPADGALTGQLAAMARERGAWIAVSDRPLHDAVATTATPTDLPLPTRYVAGVRGVSLDGQDTLSRDEDDRPVNVRRLLDLLRRAARERGRRTVFEPNGPVLWRALHRDLEELLGSLHQRGAFRPARAVEAYRVDVLPGDPRGDDGRLICELRVAPSHPLRFLTIRLERHLDGTVTAV